MAAPPSGTLTFLFTDIEGSGRRWEAQPEAMHVALAQHDAILRQVIAEHGGHVFKTMGDAVHAAFPSAADALQAAIAAQRVLATHGWGGAVRIALHTGVAAARDGDYFGPTLNRTERLRAGAHGGQVLLSAASADLIRDQLPDGVELRELGVYRLRGLSEPERVYQAAVWGLPDDLPPPALAEDRPSSLPMPLTSLVGREAEIEEIVSMLSSTRLLTLTGPGGVGKTRLAVAVAERLHRDYVDGSVFADLSAVNDSDLVAATIARVLGVRESEDQTFTDSLHSFLRDKRLLLVLDNFEQVVDAAPLLRDLLAASPGLVVLVTSRALLRLSGETECPVLPLALPDPLATPDPAVLAESPAVTLFVQRVRASQPGFALSGENAAVAAICRRLDGLPLALELAAGRMRVLSPRALLARLEHRLTILTGGARDLPRRQQALHDTIRWSYDLLSPAEQGLFRRVAVFVGGCTVAAAEAVCSLDDGPRMDVLDGLASLAEQSLLRGADGADGEPRFAMLATIREFALERLGVSGEADGMRRAHATYLLRLVRDAARNVASAGGGAAGRLDAEWDNIRAALQWCVEEGEAEVGARLLWALSYAAYQRGAVRETGAWAERLLALPEAAASGRARAPALRRRARRGRGGR